MAIDFRCTQCNKLLRTGDDTAGKQAKCPECGAIVAIPAAGTAPPGDVPPAPPPPGAEAGSPFAAGKPQPPAFDPENPYAAPGEYAPPAPGYAAPPGAFTPTIIDFGDVFNRTWTIFKEQWGMCLVAALIIIAINVVVQAPIMVLSFAMQAEGADELETFLITQALNIVAAVFLLWFNIGLSLFFLKTARGQPAALGDIFVAPGPYYLRVLGATILFFLMYLVGLALCIVPGVILALMFSQYLFLIVDRNVGVTDSLSISKEITTGNKLMLFLIILVGAGLSMLGFMACCVGIVPVAAFLGLLNAVIYLAMTGQQTADQMLPGGAAAR
ncbi:MAG: hypothetical protein ACYSWU_10025 [Planctomycetota bacterium]|jgi:phage FluMu protein Com/uncharacterized membrane protein